MTQHFLALHDYTKAELEALLTLALELKSKQKRGVPHKLLDGKTVALIFEKASTRTRVSFEVGLFQLGGHALFMSSATSQIGRGEPIKDTARVMSRYCDGIMIRTYGQEIAEEFATYSNVPVINGLTDLFHPCQIMADLLTVIEHYGIYEGRKFAWVGDGNNMANTWIEAAAIFGFNLALACPKGYEPDSGVIAWAQAKAPGRITLTCDPKTAVKDAEVLNTDVWASMGQEAEQKEREQAFAGYCLDDSLLLLAKPDCIVMHPGPVNRGVEMSSYVMDGDQSHVLKQVENGVAVRMAMLYHVCGGEME